MDVKLQVVAIIASTSLVAIVFELLRRRRLVERYAILWIFSSLVLLVLAIWTGMLEVIAKIVGIAYPPNALFAIAFAFVLVLLLHFSLAISRLSGEAKVLAQEVARLDNELRALNEVGGADAHDEAHSGRRRAVTELPSKNAVSRTSVSRRDAI